VLEPVGAPGLAVPGWLASGLDDAEARAADLIDDDRFSQAVAVLDDADASAAGHLAADHPRLLDLRSVRAAALFLGGDFRQALSAFQDLARAYARTAGPRDERVIECRRQAAYCHAELGDNEAALGELIALLDLARLGTGGDRGEEALELRHRIGIVLLAAHRLGEAAGVLGALHEDLVAARGPDDASTQDVRDLLARLRPAT
jgi:tetratricopeptide (TPR) repeat protein